jgi:hypothetical protein
MSESLALIGFWKKGKRGVKTGCFCTEKRKKYSKLLLEYFFFFFQTRILVSIFLQIVITVKKVKKNIAEIVLIT